MSKKNPRSDRAMAITCPVLALVVILLAGCSGSATSVPMVLQGTWVTQGAGFEGRSMVIGEQQITFQVEGAQSEGHHILGLYSKQEGRQLVCSLDYEQANGAEYRLHFVYDLFARELRLAGRQQVVWERLAT